MKIEVWSEGYQATQQIGKATLMGVVEAENLKEACDELFKESGILDSELYDPEDLTYWGCRLYDNQTDARRSFG